MTNVFRLLMLVIFLSRCVSRTPVETGRTNNAALFTANAEAPHLSEIETSVCDSLSSKGILC